GDDRRSPPPGAGVAGTGRPPAREAGRGQAEEEAREGRDERGEGHVARLGGGDARVAHAFVPEPRRRRARVERGAVGRGVAPAGAGTLATVSEPITVVTDGACLSNGTEDARGGWAAIVLRPNAEEEVLTGGEIPSTNNRMELTAAIEGLRAAPAGSDVELV